MNRRMSELRLEAGISRIQEVPYLCVVNKEGELVDPLEGLQKFAELIVSECRNAVRPEMHDMISRGQAFELIKQHFGVE